VATPFAQDAFLRAVADTLDRVGPPAFEVMVVRVVGSATTEAFVLAWWEAAFRGREVVTYLVAARTLHQGGAVACTDKLDLSAEHTHTFGRRALAPRVIWVGDGRNHRGDLLLEVRRVTLEVWGNHNIRSLEAGVRSEGREELVSFEDIVDPVFVVGGVYAPKLDPSPAPSGDDPDVPRGEGFAKLVATGEDGGDGDVPRQAVNKVARLGYILRPTPPEDEGGVTRGLVQSALCRLDYIDRGLPAESILFLDIVHAAIACDYDFGEAQGSGSVPWFEFA
jgi:hypothetical protein